MIKCVNFVHDRTNKINYAFLCTDTGRYNGWCSGYSAKNAYALQFIEDQGRRGGHAHGGQNWTTISNASYTPLFESPVIIVSSFSDCASGITTRLASCTAGRYKCCAMRRNSARPCVVGRNRMQTFFLLLWTNAELRTLLYCCSRRKVNACG